MLTALTIHKYQKRYTVSIKLVTPSSSTEEKAMPKDIYINKTTHEARLVAVG